MEEINSDGETLSDWFKNSKRKRVSKKAPQKEQEPEPSGTTTSNQEEEHQEEEQQELVPFNIAAGITEKAAVKQQISKQPQITPIDLTPLVRKKRRTVLYNNDSERGSVGSVVQQQQQQRQQTSQKNPFHSFYYQSINNIKREHDWLRLQ